MAQGIIQVEDGAISFEEIEFVDPQSLELPVRIHSACQQRVRQGKLCVVLLEGVSMMRQIHMMYQRDFAHTEVLADLKRIYERLG